VIIMASIRLGVAWRVFGGLAGIAALTVVASVVGVYSFVNLRDGFDRFVLLDLPAATVASTLGRRSEQIVAGAPSLVLAGGQSERELVMRRINRQLAGMVELTDRLEAIGIAPKALETLDHNKGALEANIQTLNELVERRITATGQREAQLTRALGVHARIVRLRDAVGRQAAALPAGDLERWLVPAERAVTLILAGLAESRGLAETERLPVERLQVDIEAVMAKEEKAFAALAGDVAQELAPVREELRFLAASESNVFDVHATEIRLQRSIEATFVKNAFFADRFVATTGELVSSAEREVGEHSRAMNDTLSARTKLLVAIALLCVVGAGGIADHVNRRVVRRVTRLQGAMEAYVAGREVTIPGAGNDEIADMARALEHLVATIREREAAQAEAEVRLRDAIENIPEGFVLYDADDRLVLCNRKHKELFGYSDEEAAPGVFQKELMRLDLERGTIVLKDQSKEDFYREATGHLSKGEGRFRDLELSDGRWLQVTDRRTAAGGRVGIRADITERKRAEDALRKSEERYALAMEAINEGIYDWDIEADRIEYSPKLQAMMEMPASTVSSAEDWQKRIHPHDLESFKRAIVDHLKGERDRFQCEYRVASTDQGWRWVRHHGLALRDEAGRAYRMTGSAGDVTEEKALAEALKAAEARLEDALEASAEGFALYDNDERLVQCNSTFREMYPHLGEVLVPGTRREDLLRASAESGRMPGAVGHEREWVRERLRAAGEKEGAVEEELGDGRWILIDARRTPGGGTVSVSTDITALKRRQQELTEADRVKDEALAELNAVLDSIEYGVLFLDSDLRIRIANRAYREMWAMPEEFFANNPTLQEDMEFTRDQGFYALRDQDWETYLERRLEPIRKGDIPPSEQQLADGRVVIYQCMALPGGVRMLTYFDITERKRAEEALRESEKRLRQILGNSPAAVGIVAPDGRYLFVNSRLAEMYGVHHGAMDSVRPEAILSDHAVRRGLNERLQRGETILDEELRLTRPDGSEFWSLTSMSVIDYKNKRATLFWGYDITERKQAEKELLEAKQRAEDANRLVTEKNKMLESLSAQLSKYLSPQLYASIFSGQQSVEIASKRKKLTIFFSDIAGFTEITDVLESEELTSLLNQYLTEMSAIGIEYGATIDKFVGDAIMMFFGDPETEGVRQDAVACVKMAIAMQRRMGELQVEWRDRGMEHPFQLRIGINTGYCTVGNFGSEDRMDYTIIGNEVNLTERLQSHADLGGILMANETHSLVKDMVLAEEGDTLTVKGFAKPIPTYRIVDLYDDLADQGRVLRRDQDGLSVIVDRAKLTKKGKTKAIEALEQIVQELKD
jgi:PAS domain S-box-containing protein